ncbi:hypothetical protein GCM10010439_39840 [Actinocorallia aurantiaca]|uniref:Uncharacterized protein n=1 Tax=Actinocorallia aurantiaca TaxID=46204 RepID=A0ABP6GT11_9ACTN
MQDQRGVKMPEMRELRTELARPALRKGIQRRRAEGDLPARAYFDNRMSRIERHSVS